MNPLRALWGIAALVTLSSTQAFVPAKLVAKKATLVQRFAENTVKADLSKGKLVISFEEDPPQPPPPTVPNEVFPGVALPKDKIPPPLNNKFVSDSVQGSYFPKIVFNINALVETPKSAPFTVVQEILEQVNSLGAEFAEVGYEGDYKFFGGGDHVTALITLLKTNPFWSSALTKSKDGSGFELISFDPDIEDKDKSLFLNIMETLNGVGHRVNFYFDSKMNFKSFRVYDTITGERDLVDHDKNEWATSAMYNMIFYVSCQHATIHTLHYLMTSAFQWVANDQDFEAMSQWANVYASNIQAKYTQVGQLLITNPPPIPQIIPLSPAGATTAVLGATYAILTGPMGFGSSQKVRPILKNMLDMWGTSPTAEGWITGMMNIPIKEMKDAGILTEFWKHYGLIKGFAKDAARALRKIDKEKFAAAEKDLEDYLKSCGTFQSNVESVENWVEVMAVTGMVHGSTLSYTRALADNEVLKWRNRANDRWDSGDMNLLFGGLGTIVGMEDGRHVMSSVIGEYAPELFAVLKEFDDKADRYKQEYAKELMSKPEVFNNYGWILSDFCPDGFDGKQLTMATYI